MPKVASPSSGYFAASRAPRYSYLFALPLLVLYELLAAGLQPGPGGIRNGADVILKSLVASVAGPRGPLVVAVLLAFGLLGLAWRDARRHPGGLRASVFTRMVLESVLLAGIFGTVVGLVTAQLVHVVAAPAAIGPLDKLGIPTAITLSLGAGFYEELLFRVILVGALLALGQYALKLSRGAAASLAVVIGALVFSLFHYIGAFGDTFTLQSFVYRAVAGLAFSGLFVTRGFGITAWTHALYDVFLVIARGGLG